MRSKLIVKYITSELVPVFLLGLVIFISILIMFQAFRLSEYVFVYGASVSVMLKMVMYFIMGFLPILIPVALLFCVLMTYGRLSNDSEIVAMKALGLSTIDLVWPGLIVGVIAALLSLQLSFRWAPHGERNAQALRTDLIQNRPGLAIQEGVFAEGFFDMVVYAREVNSTSGLLKKVFIYDERDPASPLTVLAKEGQIVRTKTDTGPSVFLHLKSGSIHRSNEPLYTKIDFENYDINIFDGQKLERGDDRQAPNGMDSDELKTAIENSKPGSPERITFNMEWHRRWALSLACMIFALLGLSFGIHHDRRSARGGGAVISVAVVVIYWILFIAADSIARNGYLPPYLAAWIANGLFATVAAVRLRKMLLSQ
jgi:lipopolysaccharide export system permease protein